MLVYVISSAGVPLMPCSPCKARKLLSQGCAKVMRRTPFTIKLLYDSSSYKQPVTLSVDSGSKIIGVAAMGNGKTLYASEVKLRKDIHEKLSQRASFRKTRRGRKLRYRKARWRNRKRPVGWLTPTMRSKVQAHMREISFVKSILPITRLVVETASFDIHKIVNPNVSGKDYQEGKQKDFYNVKQFVLSRDSHTCQKCKGKSKDKHLHVHHILFRSQGGSNSPDNLVTLCKTCHDALHASSIAEKESLKLQAKVPTRTADAVHVSTIAAYLKKIFPFEETFGYETKYKREQQGLKKEHYIDAIYAGLSEKETVKLPSTLYKKTCVPLGGYRQTSGHRSEKSIPTGKIFGIRKFDKVKWLGQELFVKGRMSTGYAVLMDIDGNTVNLRPMAKLKEVKRLSAGRSCLITRTPIENFRSNTTLFSSASTEKHSFLKQELANL